MSPILIATIGGLLTFLFWGASDYYAGKSSQQTNAPLSNFLIQFIGALFLIPVVLWYGFSVEFTVLLLVVLAIAACMTLAYVLYLRSLAIGPFGVAVPIANSYALITLVIGVVFLGFQTSVPQIAALVLVVIGVVVLAIDKTTLSFTSFRSSAAYFAGLTALCWGVGFALMDTVVDMFSWHELLFLVSVSITAMAFIYFVVVYKTLPARKALYFNANPYAWYAGIFITLGAIAFFATSEATGSVIIPAIIGSASPLMTSLLARIRDDEVLTTFKRVGAVAIVIGIMLLNIV